MPPEGMIPTCQEAGIIGAVAGIIGSIQSLEAIKEILEIGSILDGRLLVINTLSMEITELKINKLQNCPLCGNTPSIRQVSDYSQQQCETN